MVHLRLSLRVGIVLATMAIVAFGTAHAGAPAASGEQRVIEFKGGGTDPVNSPVDQMMQRVTKALAERTQNKIKMTYFAGAQLGGERDIVEGVQLGTVGMAVTGVTSHRIWDALWLPYVFRDGDHMWKVLRGPIGEEWNQVMLKERKMFCHWIQLLKRRHAMWRSRQISSNSNSPPVPSNIP